MRPIEDWADLKYRPAGHIAHIVPFGTEGSLCHMVTSETDWYGTGDFDEIERARELPVCAMCKALAAPAPATEDPVVTAWSDAYRERGIAPSA